MNVSSLNRESRLNVEHCLSEKQLGKVLRKKDDYSDIFLFTYFDSINNNPYSLKLVMSLCYPFSKPELYLASPLILYKYKSMERINDLKPDHEFHIYSKNAQGEIHICHSSDEQWDPSNTCVLVFLKGMLWVEAYCNYKQTGKSINDFFLELQDRYLSSASNIDILKKAILL
ncbi:MAG: hypothetical protein JXR73_16225 [Candidatus Omnitrophica bacterium]|nr:hypothetical protein [Candidatus Omnitrophota bacterium]